MMDMTDRSDKLRYFEWATRVTACRQSIDEFRRTVRANGHDAAMHDILAGHEARVQELEDALQEYQFVYDVPPVSETIH